MNTWNKKNDLQIISVQSLSSSIKYTSLRNYSKITNIDSVQPLYERKLGAHCILGKIDFIRLFGEMENK